MVVGSIVAAGEGTIVVKLEALKGKLVAGISQFGNFLPSSDLPIIFGVDVVVS